LRASAAIPAVGRRALVVVGGLGLKIGNLRPPVRLASRSQDRLSPSPLGRTTTSVDANAGPVTAPSGTSASGARGSDPAGRSVETRGRLRRRARDRRTTDSALPTSSCTPTRRQRRHRLRPDTATSPAWAAVATSAFRNGRATWDGRRHTTAVTLPPLPQRWPIAERCSARRPRNGGTCARRRSATSRSGRTARGAVADRVSRWASATTRMASARLPVAYSSSFTQQSPGGRPPGFGASGSATVVVPCRE
jgi:hypothetical protein